MAAFQPQPGSVPTPPGQRSNATKREFIILKIRVKQDRNNMFLIGFKDKDCNTVFLLTERGVFVRMRPVCVLKVGRGLHFSPLFLSFAMDLRTLNP